MKMLLPLALTLANPALAAEPVLAPGEIVAAAPDTDWVAIGASDLLVMDLASNAKGKPRRVVIQLMPPPFSQGWIGNIRKLAAAHWWDGLSINRVQDNYVVQWGDAEGEDKAKARALPGGLAVVPESEYVIRPGQHLLKTVWGFRGRNPGGGFVKWGRNSSDFRDPYSNSASFAGGFPVGVKTQLSNSTEQGSEEFPIQTWPVHCYGMVGVGRNLSPDTGSGAELYTVIGHAPRHLDRNIALVGRVIEGIEHLSSLPRGTGALGFYEMPEERTGIVSVRLGTEVPALPAYEYLSTESATFAKYADARANRRDAFFIQPAGGADVCNIPVPVRRVK